MIGKINIDTLLADTAYQIEPKDVNAAYIEAGGGLGTFLEVCCRFAHDEDNYWDITLGELKNSVIDALVKYWHARKEIERLMVKLTGVQLIDDGYFGDRYYLIRHDNEIYVLGDGVSDRERLWAIGMQMILDQYGDDQS